MALLYERQSHYPFGHGELTEMSSAGLSNQVQVGFIEMVNGVHLPLLGLGTWLTLTEHEHHVQQIYAGARRMLKKIPSLPESFTRKFHVPERFFRRKRSQTQSEYLAALEADSPEELELAIKVALDAGYRYFDTAVQYNNEHIIGKVLEKYFSIGCLKREDVFIASKLPFYGHQPEDAERHIWESLKRLKVDYIDLYLLHGPYPCKADAKGDLVQDEHGLPIPDLIDHIETWRVLEKFYRMGKIRALGVTNFNESQLKNLYNKADIKPHNIQVLLRYMIQRGISVIPRSTNPEKIYEFIKIFDFKLTQDEMYQFGQIKDRKRLFNLDFVEHHPWHPFKHEHQE